MEDGEFERLEAQLRAACVGHRPVAPDDLVGFADQVPILSGSRPSIGRLSGFARVRRGLFAAAAVVALVAGLVGGAVLVSLRQASRPAAASATVFEGWSWEPVADHYPAESMTRLASFHVAHGFIATCVTASSSSLTDFVLCSSSDGSNWSVPPDPAIVSADGADPFLPQVVVSYRGVLLASSSRAAAGEFAGNAFTLWRSTDGRSWTEVSWPAPSGMSFYLAPWVVADGFVVTASPNTLGPEILMISPDGLSWSQSSVIPLDNEVVGVPSSFSWSPFGMYAQGPRLGASGVAIWRTRDARTWEQVTLPDGYQKVLWNVQLPDGTYMALGAPEESTTPGILMSSPDGLSWQAVDTGLSGSVDAFAQVGDRLIVGLTATANASPTLVWESFDQGLSWRPLFDPSGRQVSMPFTGDGASLTLFEGPGATRPAWRLTPAPYDPQATPPGFEASTTASPDAGSSETPDASPAVSEPTADVASAGVESPAAESLPIDTSQPTTGPSDEP